MFVIVKNLGIFILLFVVFHGVYKRIVCISWLLVSVVSKS